MTFAYVAVIEAAQYDVLMLGVEIFTHVPSILQSDTWIQKWEAAAGSVAI